VSHYFCKEEERLPKDTFLNLSPDKQEKVMRATINEFNKNGFEKGNIGDIAKSAGVAKGSIYQYFENKRELFLYAVKWGLELMLKKFAPNITLPNEEMDIFEFLYENSKTAMKQIGEERELGIFIQNVFLGKYSNLTDASMEYMIKLSNEYIVNLIQIGQKNGSVRSDIDVQVLSIYTLGATYKLKENMMNRARERDEDILDEEYEQYENDIKAMIELLRHGMGGR
jgi:AcrR family transcriptional regulator